MKNTSIKLENTGERFLPEIEGETALEHLHRYLFACEFVKGKEVLDIASGEGYGSFMLAGFAKHVIGVDISNDAVLHAQKSYLNKNLNYIVGSCDDIPLENHSVDVIVSFETIEHHDQHEKMMSEFCRVLRPEGLLIISSPDKYLYSDLPGFKNPFHIKELYKDEFKNLISKTFKNTLIAGQKIIYGSNIVFEEKKIKSISYNNKFGKYDIYSGTSDPIYTIIFASNSSIPTVFNAFLDGDIEKSEPFRKSANEIISRDVQIVYLEQEINQRDARLVELAQAVGARDRQLSVLDQSSAQTIAERDARIVELAQTVNARDRQLSALDQSRAQTIAERDARISELAQAVDARDQQLSALDQSRAQTIAERDARISELAQAVDARDQQLSALDKIMIGMELQIAQLNQKYAEADAKYQAIERSMFWRISSPLRHVLDRYKLLKIIMYRIIRYRMGTAPVNSRNAKALKSDITEKSDIAPLLALLPNQKDGKPYISKISDSTLEPVISLNQMRQQEFSICFVIKVSSINAETLERTVQSILRQTDPTWELLLCPGNGGEDIVNAWLDIDWRIRCFPDISDGRNDLIQAASRATCDYIGFIDQGDVIQDDLVNIFLKTASSEPLADIIYTDESCFEENDITGEHFFKPDWSPDHFDSVNYIGRFVAIRKRLLLNATEGHAAGAEVSEYSLLCDITRRAKKIVHIDEPLYVRLNSGKNRLGGFFTKSYLVEAKAVLEKHVRAENPHATVMENTTLGALRVNWPVPPDTPVTLVILTGMRRRIVPGRGDIVLATHFVKSIIDKSTYKDYKILVVDDGNMPEDLRALLITHGHKSCAYENGEGPFSFARKANFAVRQIPDGIIILLNDDLEVISPDWIETLAGFAARPSIGAAGARLLHVNGSIQHAGLTLGYHGSVGHMLHKVNGDGSEYGGFASIERNFSAVTAAAIAFRREVFDEAGGFDEFFRVDYNDVDFCLRLGDLGYRVVLTPAATLYHFHNSSFQRDHDNGQEKEEFVRRWVKKIDRDPFFSKNFQKKHHDLPLVHSDIGTRT